LHRAPVLPGAQRRATAPGAELRHAVAASHNGNPIVRRGDWFTAPGTMDEAIAYLRAHVPAGMRFSGTGSGAHYGVVTSQDISYANPSSGNVRDAFLNIFVAPYRGGVGVGMYATANWVPSRPPGYLIEDATSVTVTVRRGGAHPQAHAPHAPSVRRTLTGPAVAELARTVNRLQPAYLVNISCPYGLPGFDDTLVFATPAGPVRVLANITGCAGTELRYPGRRQLQLQAGNLNHAVLHALGLPPKYGFR
jgi:hypothetical protein